MQDMLPEITQQLRRACEFTNSIWVDWCKREWVTWFIPFYHGLRKSQFDALISWMEIPKIAKNIVGSYRTDTFEKNWEMGIYFRLRKSICLLLS